MNVIAAQKPLIFIKHLRIQQRSLIEMPAKDIYHESCKQALLNDGWHRGNYTMDKLNTYRRIICDTLQPFVDIAYANVNVKNRAAFDIKHDQYVIISEGWDQQRHLHSVLLHIEIINDKIWVQYDGTEDGITDELLKHNVPKEDIVLGFHEPEVRPYTGFAVA